MQLPTEAAGIKKFLGQGFAKGIGEATAKKIITAFGGEALKVLETNPEQFLKISGMSKSKLDLLVASWETHRDLSAILVPLMDLGISKILANKIFKKYGKEAHVKVRNNPYLLIHDLWGIGFLRADEIALRAGLEHNSLERLKAAIQHILKTHLESGSLYLELETFYKQCLQLLKLETNGESQELLSDASQTLINQNIIRKITWHGKELITFEKVFLAEAQLATMLTSMAQKPASFTSTNITSILRNLETPAQNRSGLELELSTQQQDAICTSLVNKITIITGGPGTGKTTLLKTLIKVLQQHKQSFLLAAPTGRAAKRMKQATLCFAQTLHRLLEYNPVLKKFEKNMMNKIKTDFVIIDEFSMVDLFLANAIMQAVEPNNTQLIFIGDVDQLPSVGPGKILADLISSKKIPVIKLSKVFRQQAASLITENAHRVNASTFPITSGTNFKKDFTFTKMDAPELLAPFLKECYQKIFVSHAIPAEQTVVLTPMHRGIAGSIQINTQLQQILNGEQKEEVIVGGQVFKVGDPVMQRHNNYDKAVFNGDMGKITAIKTIDQDKIIEVAFEGKTATYKFPQELFELTLAYAISIHKSQGSEFSAAIIPIFTQHFMMLNKNVLYTAITRAKNLCLLVGQVKAIAIAVKNCLPDDRVTLLKEFLNGQISQEIVNTAPNSLG
jgi:exodeoxyribonuclease V alpha subunit